MARADFYTRVDHSLNDIKREGLWKPERIIASAQNAKVAIAERQAINTCANNYLGLANDARVVEGAINATRSHGAGLPVTLMADQLTHPLMKERIVFGGTPAQNALAGIDSFAEILDFLKNNPSRKK